MNYLITQMFNFNDVYCPKPSTMYENLEPANYANALCIAVQYYPLSHLEYLLDMGVNINARAKNRGNLTALETAIRHGRCAQLEVLVERGAAIPRVPSYIWRDKNLSRHMIFEICNVISNERSMRGVLLLMQAPNYARVPRKLFRELMKYLEQTKWNPYLLQ